MNPIKKTNDKRLCRTCGTDITHHARYTHWTQCALCYWKGRLENCSPLESLLKDRSDLKQQIQVAEQLLVSVSEEKVQKEYALKASTPWWKSLLGIDIADEELQNLRRKVASLRNELYQLKQKLDRLESSIKTARHVRKRFDSAVKMANAMRIRQQKHAANKQAFDNRVRSTETNSYDRTKFSIRKKDYKRGNRLDNHFRNRFFQETLSAFDNKCLFCGSRHDLTLDHFAIPKNEGGNFILLLSDQNSIRVNLVVLCRSCNSAKGESAYDYFFDNDKLNIARAYQKRLLDAVLEDSETMDVIKAWYSIRI